MKKEQKCGGAARVTFSQNFITDTRLLHRIVDKSNIGKSDTVWEIGTGKGHLAQVLCGRCGRLYSVEIDKGLYEKAGARLAGERNVKLICGDFLKTPLPSRGRYKVFANIPFFITTQIVDRLAYAPNPPEDMWLIMEKGAAKRFAGQPGETGRSLLLKPWWDMEIAYYFRRSDFHPMPSVDCVMVHFSRKAQPDLERQELSAYREFTARALRHGVCGRDGALTKKQVRTALRLAKLPPIPTGGEILYVQWLCLFRCYMKKSLDRRK